jgi:hypothetical protein
MAAEALAKVQRLSGWAMRSAIAVALDGGADWTGLCAHAQVPIGTLQRQWRHGGRIIVEDLGVPTEPHYELEPEDDASDCPGSYAFAPILAVESATCEACGMVVGLAVAPDGGAGPVLEAHPAEGAR